MSDEQNKLPLWKQQKDSPEVAELQAALNSLIKRGLLEGKEITEAGYGRQTRDTVRKLQFYLKEHNFTSDDRKEIAVDGAYGPKTSEGYKKLWKELLPTPAKMKQVFKNAVFSHEIKPKSTVLQILHVPVEECAPKYNYGALRPEYSTNDGTVVSEHKHEGLDIYAPVGTPVHAVAAGKVTNISTSRSGEGGMQVSLTHMNGTRSRYLHLDKIKSGLKIGDSVAAGENLGTIGRTGFAKGSKTPAHLHFAIETERGKSLNPSNAMQIAYSVFEQKRRMVAMLE